MVTHSSTLAWKIPWTEGTRLSDFTLFFHFHALEKEMATHSIVLAWRIPGTGEPAVYGVAQSWTRLKRLSSSSSRLLSREEIIIYLKDFSDFSIKVNLEG